MNDIICRRLSLVFVVSFLIGCTNGPTDQSKDQLVNSTEPHFRFEITSWSNLHLQLITRMKEGRPSIIETVGVVLNVSDRHDGFMIGTLADNAVCSIGTDATTREVRGSLKVGHRIKVKGYYEFSGLGTGMGNLLELSAVQIRME
jgi:hypothetical protein